MKVISTKEVKEPRGIWKVLHVTVEVSWDDSVAWIRGDKCE